MENKKQHYQGLTDAEVLKSRELHGVNILTPPEKETLWKKFLGKFYKFKGQEEEPDSLIRILLIAGIFAIGVSCFQYFDEGITEFLEPIGIFVAILLATVLSFYFELLADKEFSILNQVNDDESVKVIRDGNALEIPKKDIVVGDIVILSTGDEVPADAELLDIVTLSMDESSLTGEAICEKFFLSDENKKVYEYLKKFKEDIKIIRNNMPVTIKGTDELLIDDIIIIDRNEYKIDSSLLVAINATYPTNYVLRGTKVMEGHGICRVFAVGDKTENGKVFEAAQIDNSIKTPLNEQLDGLSELITILSYLFAGMVIIGRLLVFFDWNWMAFSLLIPTIAFFYLVIKKFEDFSRIKCILSILIFFIVFIAMAVGIFQYLKPGENILVLLKYIMKTLMIAVTLIVVAVPEGLPMAVTLSLAYSMRRMLKTNNLVRKMHACETMGATTVICTDKTGTLTQNQMKVYQTNFYSLSNQNLSDDEISVLVKEGIAVNSTASLDLSDATKVKVLGNPTEGALLLWLKDNGLNYQTLKDNTVLIEELPFTTERKYMATVVQSSLGKKVLYVKGAPEIIHSLCKQTCGNIDKASIDKQLSNYQEQAMRTLGFAYQELNDDDVAINDNRIVAQNLTFLGVVAISDPVREDVPAAVEECIKAGIAVKIVTGDTPGTAKEIGRQIGLWTNNDNDKNIIAGPEFAALSNDELDKKVLDLKIIARARPMDKKRLVEALQRKNQVVAVTGDGTNDAPALNAAHVGLSMGDGTSVAKEASDITIIDNSFSSIGRAVMWGRSLYQNIQRFLLFQLTVNVAACFIVLVGAFMGQESPLTVTQMLWVNLIMDTFGAMALASLPPSHEVMNNKPRDRKAFILNKAMSVDIWGVGLFFFALTLGFLYIFQHADITSMKDFLSLHLGDTNAVTPYEQTLLFSIFVWTHFWYMFNARSFGSNSSFFKLKQSTGFVSIVGVIVVGQIVIVELLYEFFNVQPMFHTIDWQFNLSGFVDWLTIVGLSSLVLWVREIWHFITKK